MLLSLCGPENSTKPTGPIFLNLQKTFFEIYTWTVVLKFFLIQLVIFAQSSTFLKIVVLLFIRKHGLWDPFTGVISKVRFKVHTDTLQNNHFDITVTEIGLELGLGSVRKEGDVANPISFESCPATTARPLITYLIRSTERTWRERNMASCWYHFIIFKGEPWWNS